MSETDSNGSAATWNVYLSGEIHSDWRERIAEGVEGGGGCRSSCWRRSPTTPRPMTWARILGAEAEGFWKDHKGAGVNAVRTQTLLRRADVVVVRFGTGTASGTPRSRPATRRPWASR